MFISLSYFSVSSLVITRLVKTAHTRETGKEDLLKSVRYPFCFGGPALGRFIVCVLLIPVQMNISVMHDTSA